MKLSITVVAMNTGTGGRWVCGWATKASEFDSTWNFGARQSSKEQEIPDSFAIDDSGCPASVTPRKLDISGFQSAATPRS
jgi:hypothetical protein